MRLYSIFNDVLGPVMRGPSSSHTAASHRIGAMARSLLGREPSSVRFVFDPDGSYGRVYHEQGSDLALVAGILGWSITDDRFPEALDEARRQNIDIEFALESMPHEKHPNAVEIIVDSPNGDRLYLRARSIGGGSIQICRFQGWPVNLHGDAYSLLILAEKGAGKEIESLLSRHLDHEVDIQVTDSEDGDRSLFEIRSLFPYTDDLIQALTPPAGVNRLWTAPPLLFVPVDRPGSQLFRSGQEMVELAENRGESLGRLALAYEARLLGLPNDHIMSEMGRRLDIMLESIKAGLDPAGRRPAMRTLKPSAPLIMEAEARGHLALGGPLTRAAGRAMAVMHVNASSGLVCAAPTGGSAGVLPGVIKTLMEEKRLDRDQAIFALLAASAIGLVILMRGDTFAAEVAGCQVEIGAAGAMAAAAVVEAAGGSADQAANAAAIALQNTMGSPCDLVRGAVEIPCHTRNAVAASSAFICADLILGGYENPIPLDETMDASLEVGRNLPQNLRCTSLGGLAITPSAQKKDA